MSTTDASKKRKRIDDEGKKRPKAKRPKSLDPIVDKTTLRSESEIREGANRPEETRRVWSVETSKNRTDEHSEPRIEPTKIRQMTHPKRSEESHRCKSCIEFLEKFEKKRKEKIDQGTKTIGPQVHRHCGHFRHSKCHYPAGHGKNLSSTIFCAKKATAVGLVDLTSPREEKSTEESQDPANAGRVDGRSGLLLATAGSESLLRKKRTVSSEKEKIVTDRVLPEKRNFHPYDASDIEGIDSDEENPPVERADPYPDAPRLYDPATVKLVRKLVVRLNTSLETLSTMPNVDVTKLDDGYLGHALRTAQERTNAESDLADVLDESWDAICEYENKLKKEYEKRLLAKWKDPTCIRAFTPEERKIIERLLDTKK
jgi:hypothetical protein